MADITRDPRYPAALEVARAYREAGRPADYTQASLYLTSRDEHLARAATLAAYLEQRTCPDCHGRAVGRAFTTTDYYARCAWGHVFTDRA